MVFVDYVVEFEEDDEIKDFSENESESGRIDLEVNLVYEM